MGQLRAWVLGLVVMPLLAALVAGCGGSDRGDGQSGSASVGSVWSTAEAATLGFGDYLGFASGKKCDLLEPELDDPTYFVGSMSTEVLEGYSCDKVVTARERGRQCDRVAVSPTIKGGPVTVSTKPRRLRYSVEWKGETVCRRDTMASWRIDQLSDQLSERSARPGNDVYDEHGSYDVTVEQGNGGGWLSASPSGPGPAPVTAAAWRCSRDGA